ncbi:MAG TPA: Zn-dependent hydrolase [Terriglobales bacterium]
MNNRGVAVFLLSVSLLILAGTGIGSQSRNSSREPRSAQLRVVPDLKQRLARFRQVNIPFHAAGLTARERKMILKLVDASRYLEDICWRQVDPDGLELYASLQGSANPKDVELRRYLWINGSRFDLTANNQPFVGTDPPSPGAGFYPQGLTREQVERYVNDHPEKRAGVYSPTTIVRWHGNDLEAVPYHIAYRAFLEPAAKDLREAAEMSSDAAFASYLRLRAQALLDDDYFQSDIAWLDLKDPKIDLIFAPYESYADNLLGVKGTYGAAVLIRDDAQSRRMEKFQQYVAQLQEALPVPPRDRPSLHQLQTPMEVVDAPFRAGDLDHGYQAVADNLPNDPRVHEKKGTKKIFFADFMDARVTSIVIPLAHYLMPVQQALQVTPEGYLLGTVMHEISHGLGPAFAHNAKGDSIDIREAIGPIFSGLEEAKADVVGMFVLKWLVDRGALPKGKLQECYASYVADIFRSLRFGVGEAHAQGEMMEFNYLLEHGAIHRQPSGRYALQYDAMPGQIESLAKELLELEANGDRARAEAWFKKYDVIPPELHAALQKASNVPVDIDPLFTFPREAR